MTSAMAESGRLLPDIPGALPGLPNWVPVPARQYLAHVSAGQSLRAIARAAGEPPSTVSRRVRRLERRRDDPLLDEALTALGPLVAPVLPPNSNAE